MYTEDKESIRLHNKLYRLKNLKKCREISRKYYESHKEELKAKMRVYGKIHRNRIKERKHLKHLDNPQLSQEHNLKYNYQITLGGLELINASQGGKCKLCRKEKELVVDHDHDSGKIRGLLCRNCNLMLGHSYDDPVLLRLGASYLEV